MTVPRPSALMRAALALAAVAAYGTWAIRDVTSEGITRAHYSSLNVFFHLFADFEPVPLAALGLFAVVSVALAMRAPSVGDGASSDAPALSQGLTSRATWALGAAAMLLAWAIQRWVLHGFPLSMDEFNTGFEATILTHGRLFEPVKEEWIGFVPAIKPVFVAWRNADHAWYSGYIPVYAALRALFQLLHAEAWLNPLCAGGSVVVVASLARRLRPAEPVAPLVAVLALVTSAQFLVTSGSQYTMPAHLLVNLVWTWLVLRDDRVSIGAAALLGGLALGLHNPFPHALFALPFFWRWLVRKAYARFVVTTVVYLAFSWIWLGWLRMERGGEPGAGGGLLSLFALPGLAGWRLSGMNLALVFTWQAPVTAFLLVIAFLREDRLGDTEKDLARGVLLTFLFYVLYGSSQGHGWGYRYVHGVLGSIALLAASAAPVVVEALGLRRARALTIVGASLALLTVGLRLVQVERFAAPFAEASAYLAALDADVVVVEAGAVWYGRDLVRNDAALSRPVIVNGSMLSGQGWDALRTRYGNQIMLVAADSLKAHGMQRISPRERQPAPKSSAP